MSILTSETLNKYGIIFRDHPIMVDLFISRRNLWSDLMADMRFIEIAREKPTLKILNIIHE